MGPRIKPPWSLLRVPLTTAGLTSLLFLLLGTVLFYPEASTVSAKAYEPLNFTALTTFAAFLGSLILSLAALTLARKAHLPKLLTALTLLASSLSTAVIISLVTVPERRPLGLDRRETAL